VPAPEPVSEPEAIPPPAAEPVIDPSLLDAKAETDPVAPVHTRPVGAATTAGDSPEEKSAAIDAAYAALYRPPENPLRLNITARAAFANVSGKDRVNGRMGGASVDIGPAWNRIGVAATLSGWGGRILLAPQTGAEMRGMLGAGLTLGLGRLALLSRGFVDLRVGYDLYYGVVGQRADAPAIVAPQANDPQVVASFTENLLPHGPRIRLDLGLIGSNNRRRYFHGFGLSMGYQALVGSVRGDLPVTSMLIVGISYWMG